MSDAEYLEVGDDRGSGLSWRVRLMLVVGAVVIAVVGLAVDRDLRQREERAVATCESQVNAAMATVGSELRATYEYVRPSLIDPSPELQAAMRRLFAKSARGAGAPLRGPLETCLDVTVFPLHDELQARRDGCVDVLQAHRSGLAAVAADGGELGEWLGTPRSC